MMPNCCPGPHHPKGTDEYFLFMGCASCSVRDWYGTIIQGKREPMDDLKVDALFDKYEALYDKAALIAREVDKLLAEKRGVLKELREVKKAIKELCNA